MASYSYSSSREHEYAIKAVIIGDLGVGKTTFLHTYMAGKFTRSKSSIEVQETKEKILMRNNKHIRLQLWDTAGQEKYRSLTASYYRGAHACIILFDVGNADSFENVHRWYEDIKEYASNKELAVMLVGTKCHVPDREVPQEKAAAFATEHEIPYMEVSAERDIESVNKVCDRLVEEVLDKVARHHSSQSLSRTEVSKLTGKQKRKRSWCSC